jgi:hypothetical protein
MRHGIESELIAGILVDQSHQEIGSHRVSHEPKVRNGRDVVIPGLKSRAQRITHAFEFAWIGGNNHYVDLW